MINSGYSIGSCPKCYNLTQKNLLLKPVGGKLTCPSDINHRFSDFKHAFIVYLDLIKADYSIEAIDKIVSENVAKRITTGK